MVTMKSYGGFLATALMAVVSAGMPFQNQQHNHHQDRQRTEGVNARGDHAMGFSHEKTTHHFRLIRGGGFIEVTANEPGDVASQEQIRTHLQQIAELFKEGDFGKPMFIHAEEPPGVPAMRRFKADITYTVERIERGARVRIDSANSDAVEAIHEFLRYQIKDHRTGDSLNVDKAAK